MRTGNTARLALEGIKASHCDRLLATHRAICDEIRILRFKAHNLSPAWPDRCRLQALENRLGYVELALHVFCDHHLGTFDRPVKGDQGRGITESRETGREP